MSKSFFLTRQTANLMEDFVRELSGEPALFLLYGDEGVGKTRALEELVRTRLGDATIHWVDLKAGGSGDDVLVDSSAMIEAVFAKAKAGDIVIADHFERALKKTRHQLFLSWSTDGIDKKVSMIIASNTEFFNELRQLAQQYQVRVQSIQQMPMNPDEVAAFLGFYLFPDRPIGNLSLPPLLRNQVALAQGNIGKIIEIAERAGDQITMAPLNDNEQIRQGSRVLVGVLIAILLVVAASWYFISGHNSAREVQRVEADGVPAGQLAQADTVADSAAGSAETRSAVPDATQDSPASIAPEELQSEAQPESRVETATRVDVEGGAKAGDEMIAGGDAIMAPVDTQASEEPSVDGESTEDTAANSSEAEPPAPEPAAGDAQMQQQEALAEPAQKAPLDGADSASQVTIDEPAQMGRLQRDLQSSLEWINARERKIGTLQIMLLSIERFDEDAYYDYIDSIASRGIDAGEIRIFRTFTGGRGVYSVVYGEFESWKAAGNAKGDIPEILRRNSPIPRSVSGLLDEMRRLEEQN